MTEFENKNLNITSKTKTMIPSKFFQNHTTINVLIIFMLLLSSSAKADQLAWISLDKAKEATELLKEQKNVILWCACCSNEEPVLLTIENVYYKKVNHKDFYQVVVEGRDKKGTYLTENVDLAYVHLLHKNFYITVGQYLGYDCDPCTDAFQIVNNKIKIRNPTYSEALRLVPTTTVLVGDRVIENDGGLIISLLIDQFTDEMYLSTYYEPTQPLIFGRVINFEKDYMYNTEKDNDTNMFSFFVLTSEDTNEKIYTELSIISALPKDKFIVKMVLPKNKKIYYEGELDKNDFFDEE